MSTLKENFFKNRGLGVNPLNESLVNDKEKISLQKAIKLLSSYANDSSVEWNENGHGAESAYVKMIADIVKDLQSLEQKI